MKKHHGMRPQDVAVLLKIVIKGSKPWQNKDLATELHLSQSEVSESLNRSAVAGLVAESDKKKVFRNNLVEFIEYGLHYVFPVIPGNYTRGMGTSHSHPNMKKRFPSDMHYVWADLQGDAMGLEVEPLYKGQVKAAKQDPELYQLLALIDVFRVGNSREKKFAKTELHKLIING